MQPLAEPLLRDAAPEPPAGTARLLLTSHVLTKFGSKAWEVPSPPKRTSPPASTEGNPSPPQPCYALLSRHTSRVCEQFATPLLLLEFSPGDLGAPSIFGLSVLLFKVRRRRPLHAYTRPSLSPPPPLPSSPAPQHLPS